MLILSWMTFREDWNEIAQSVQLRLLRADEEYGVIWSSASLQQEFYGKDALAQLRSSEDEYFEYGHDDDVSDIDEIQRLIQMSEENELGDD